MEVQPFQSGLFLAAWQRLLEHFDRRKLVVWSEAFINPKQRRKYDHFLSDELLNWSIAQDVIDLEGANDEITSILKYQRQ